MFAAQFPSTTQAAGASAPPQAAGEVLPVRGVIRAVEQASVSTEGTLRSLALPFREGQRFKRGELLAAFDCRRQQAEYKSALAMRREARLQLESNLHLDRHNAVGRFEVEIARARLEKAEGELTVLETRMSECQLVAPFDGRVVELGLRVHEHTVPQRPYITIIDDTRLEIELIAPSSMLKLLQPGTRFTFGIDELDRSFGSSIDRTGAAVDPVSKTVKVMATLDGPPTGVLAGMSGTARFPAMGQR